jgi:uncharacterized membrane protein
VNRWLLFVVSIGFLSIALSPLSETGYVIFLLMGIIIVIAGGIPLVRGMVKANKKGKKS